MSAAIYLVRHGEVANPDHIVYADLPGFGLSDRGKQQAAAAARRLVPVATVITSPLPRAVETAAIIAEVAGTEVAEENDLTEWWLLRRWRGLRWEDLEFDYPGELAAYLDHPTDLPFSPESLTDLAERVTKAVRRWRNEMTGPLAFVSHQDPIQVARLSLTGRPLSVFQQNKPAHAEVVELTAPARSDDGAWAEVSSWAPHQ